MPEVWLNVGIDYDGDGRVSPFGKPDDALGSSARYLVNRGKYRRGEHWGYEVALPGGSRRQRRRPTRHGTSAASRAPTASRFRSRSATAQLWVPVAGGPAFLLGAEFLRGAQLQSVDELRARDLHLGDRLLGGAPFVQPFPGSRTGADARRSAGNADAA